jgi:GTP diphosphokinase / guanosine-3',5'-bis(diphosphate) 3'-diphosphatase
VHTNVGHSCVGAKVNGRHMPLISELKNGDEVDIITSDAQSPPPAWESIVVTGKARSAIRRATREAERKQYGSLGREIVKGVFQQHGKDYADALVTDALPRLPTKTVDDVMMLVGRGELAAFEVFKATFPGEQTDDGPKRKAIKRSDEGWFNLRRINGLKFRWPGGHVPDNLAAELNGHFPSRDGADLPIAFAPGGAIPGERVVGIFKLNDGITIYPIHYPALKDYFEQLDRWIDVTWDIDEGSQERYPAQIKVTAINQPGSLAAIANIIGETNGNIDKLQMVGRRADFTDMVIDIEVWDLKHLRDIMGGLRNLSSVSTVERAM